MYTLLIFYCVIIAIASLFGGSVPQFFKLTHQRIQLILSLVSGVMLGVAFFHLIPHAIYVLESVELTLGVALGGLLFMFFMVRMFHFHQHDLAVDAEHDHKHKHLCDDEHDHHHVHCQSHDGALDLSWAGLCFGLAVHTIIDGIALAATVQASSPAGWSLAGLGVFLAIVLHKPLDALSITSLMSVRGWDVNKQMTVSLMFSLMCPLGAILFAFGIDQFVEYRNLVLGLALAFSAGIFLCISLGDLLPEVHFHSHDRIKLSAMLFLGVAIAFLIESMHDHRGESVSSARLEHNGTTMISNATGKVELRKRNGKYSFELDLGSLPTLSDASLELWISDLEAKSMYSLGRIGSNRLFELPEGVEPSEFPVVEISAEPLDGNPTYNGQSVLSGRLEF
ncbi:MAG: ZIP family metal transporter [Mariniblastus sp.]|nr:ZIP family metal transporter [Mariniblastus sp.]